MQQRSHVTTTDAQPSKHGTSHQRPRGAMVVLSAAVAAVLANAFPSAAMGAAWTLPKGKWLTYFPIQYTVVDQQFNHSGERVDRPRFQMFEFSPYFAYGLTDGLTGGFQPNYRRVTVAGPNGDLTNSGVASTDVFGRVRLWHHQRAAFSVQALATIPVKPDENSAVPLGRNRPDVELSLLYGNQHTFSAGTLFYNAGLGFRKRFGHAANEVLANAFIGWSHGSWTLVADSSNVVGLNNQVNGVQVLTAEPSFRQHQVQLSGAYHFTPRVSGIVGVSHTYAGRDIGAANTGFLAMTWRY